MENRLKEILRDVGEIGQLVGQIKENVPVQAIEIDIILEKIRGLYEEVRRLESIPSEKAPEPAEVIPESLDEKPEPEILADMYKDEKRYINETLSRKDNNQDLTSKLQSKPIKNIQSALGINDRFKLINNLFNGDKESFENTIGILDNAGNFNDAFTYINSSFEWDMEDESVQMLLDLVRRKFIVNQDE